jgi:hypothetical protein
MKADKTKAHKPRKGTLSTAAAAMVAAAEAQELTQKSQGRPPTKPKPRTREGKKGLVLYVEPEITVAIRQLALAQGTDVQSLGREALTLLFATYGTPLPNAARATRT